MANFDLVYSTILDYICNRWIHDEDSGCDYANLGEREVFEMGNYKIIFQPVSDGCQIYLAHVLILLKKGAKINKNAITRINEILVNDYIQAKKDCNNKWFCDYDEITFEKILNIKKPLEKISANKYKLTFVPHSDIYGGGMRGWIPKNIQKKIGNFNEEWYKEICEYIQG